MAATCKTATFCSSFAVLAFLVFPVWQNASACLLFDIIWYDDGWLKLLRPKFHQWSVIGYLLEHFTNDPGWDCTVFSLLSKKFLLFLSKYCHSFEIQSLFITEWTCSLAVPLHLLVLHQSRGSCLSYVWKGSLNMIHYVFKRNKEKSI